MSTYLCRFLGLVALVWLAGTGTLPAQTEYAVLIREATRETTFGAGGTSSRTYKERYYGVCRIDFSGSFARPFTYQGVLNARKKGRVNQFAPFSDRDPVYTGVSYLADIGRGNQMETLLLTVDEPDKRIWLFPQGRASAVQLVTDGATRRMATRLVAPFAFWVEPDEQTMVNSLGTAVTLDPALSRRLNARSPADLTDAGDKLITLLEESGWQNLGPDAF